LRGGEQTAAPFVQTRTQQLVVAADLSFINHATESKPSARA
jgi:hypothetical protein